MPVPLVKTAPASEFGDFTETADFKTSHIQDRDMSYVPGFSDMRRGRDVAMAEYVNHQRDKASIPVLPVNLRWGRTQKGDGKPDSTKVYGHSLNGYRMATKADIGQPWLTALPPGAEQCADGTIRKGDVALMVATKEQAAKNAFYKAKSTADRVSGMESGFAAQASKDGAGWKGADPTVTKESTTSPINVPVAKAAAK